MNSAFHNGIKPKTKLCVYGLLWRCFCSCFTAKNYLHHLTFHGMSFNCVNPYEMLAQVLFWFRHLTKIRFDHAKCKYISRLMMLCVMKWTAQKVKFKDGQNRNKKPVYKFRRNGLLYMLVLFARMCSHTQ